MTAHALRFAALSDVGRVRKDNQDSGYAGPWLLGVWDGVGGAARGDIASSTAGKAFSEIDAAPGDGEDTLQLVENTLTVAHDAIAELVGADPALKGTSTTATVLRFTGNRVGIGHVGDSRAYLLRDGELSQLTSDHTFVQGLIDDGRISEAEARTHPQRNLILKALDGFHDVDPDLFEIEVVPGDRLLVCSDGVCGVLDGPRLSDILATGTPDYAAVELIRASLDAGSSDNVTAVVADVVSADDPERDPAADPLPVGALAPSGFFGSRGPTRRLFTGHRSGDTGELPVIEAELLETEGIDFAIESDPVDPEELRYAPQPPTGRKWLRVLLTLVVVAGLLWAGLSAARAWAERQFFVSDSGGVVVIYRGIDAEFGGLDLAEPYRISDVELDRLSEFDAENVRSGIQTEDLEAAEETVQQLAEKMQPEATP